tara:strand:+ start:5167 stop:6297 length:1131 start_codon:yes stop_codon:yes gene_type:complete
MEKLYSLKGVDIFRVGRWKGKPFLITDLDDMVSNFNKFKENWFIPAIKDGHHTEPGKPRLGSITNLVRKGEKLFADLIEMPKVVYEAVKNHKYDGRSIELMRVLKRDGKTYKNVITALSILGVEVPEVDGLKPLREYLTTDQGDIISFDIDEMMKEDVNDDDQEDLKMDAKIKELKDKYEADIKKLTDQITEANGKIKEFEKDQNTDASDKVKTLMNSLNDLQGKLTTTNENFEKSQKRISELEEGKRTDRIKQKVDKLNVPAFKFYATQFYDWATQKGDEIITFSVDGEKKEMLPEQIVDEFCSQINKATDNLFIQSGKVEMFKRDDMPVDENPRVEVDKRVIAYQAEHPEVDYQTAMKHVFTTDPRLKEAYAKI